METEKPIWLFIFNDFNIDCNLWPGLAAVQTPQ